MTREILKIVDPNNVVQGVDLSPRMLERARRLIHATVPTIEPTTCVYCIQNPCVTVTP
jgi:hypothetical protein